MVPMQGARQHFTCTSCAAVGQEYNRLLGQLTRLCGEDLPRQGARLHTQQTCQPVQGATFRVALGHKYMPALSAAST